MDDELVCPVCETDEHLLGTRDGDVIHVRCERCGAAWDRDLRPRCRRCGSEDLWTTAQAVWERSRGTQRSIVAVRTVHVCPTCEPDRYARVIDSNTPLPPDDDPAAT